jgi:periplasmic divalent cation tolerance protein
VQTEYIVVLLACPKSEAGILTEAIISAGLAACIQRTEMTSTYIWKGKIVSEPEERLMLKTKSVLFDRIEALVREKISYETAQIIALPVQQANRDYLDWINEVTV